MNKLTSGSTGVQLKEATECKLMLENRILLQKVKDSRGDKKLASTENGRKALAECLLLLLTIFTVQINSSYYKTK